MVYECVCVCKYVFILESDRTITVSQPAHHNRAILGHTINKKVLKLQPKSII